MHLSIGVYLLFALALAELLGLVFCLLKYRVLNEHVDNLTHLTKKLSRIILTYREIDTVFKEAAKSIGGVLEASTASVLIYERGMPRVIGNQPSLVLSPGFSSIKNQLSKHPGKLISYQGLASSGNPLASLLMQNKLSIVISLSTPEDIRHGRDKYLCLGPKRSGGIYSFEDIEVVKSSADLLVIASDNAQRLSQAYATNLLLHKDLSVSEVKLKRAHDKLRNVDETRDDFISMASHQLRTPLTSIKGYLSMMSEGDAGKLNKTQKEMVNQAYISSQRMVFLIADMLNISRIKTGRFAILTSPVDLSETIEQELSQLTEIAAARQLTLVYNKPDKFPTLMLDDTKLRQVIMNLLDNAIYYTPPGGHIDVDLEDNPGAISFKVKDNGISVPEREKRHLFTKFYRANNARQTRPDGTGIGLYMVKKVIISHGGSIIFDSQPGKGSTFGFRLAKTNPPSANLDKKPTPVSKPKVTINK